MIKVAVVFLCLGSSVASEAGIGGQVWRCTAAGFKSDNETAAVFGAKEKSEDEAQASAIKACAAEMDRCQIRECWTYDTREIPLGDF